jgi:hypothetical protein
MKIRDAELLPRKSYESGMGEPEKMRKIAPPLYKTAMHRRYLIRQ